MTEQSAIICRDKYRIESVAKVIGFGLSFSAVVAACCIGFFTEAVIPVENPTILVLASFLILVPFKSEALSSLQMMMCFYLFSILVNQISGQYFPFPISFGKIDISYSIIPLLLCGLGYLTSKVNSTNVHQFIEGKNMFYAWIVTFTIITVHIILLSLILRKFYGYGYERNLSTAGNLMLYLLLFILLWKRLGNLRFRRSMGLVLASFYLISIFMNK